MAHPDTGGAVTTRTVGMLADTQRHELRRLVEQDPIVNAVLANRLDAVTSLSPRRLGGTVLGVRDGQGRLTAAAFHGGNLLPVAGDEEAWTALGRRLATEARVCSSIVGTHASVATLWDELQHAWDAPRVVRERQPLLVLDVADAPDRLDPDVRPVGVGELDAYLPAAAAMFTEELGVSPFRAGGGNGEYRRRLAGLVRERRAFARFDAEGKVVFKADLGAVSRHTCQVQGVWVRPDLRGQGLAAPALATVFAHALALAPTVSLYVNDFNIAARRLYARLGMREIGTLSTILF